MKMFVKVLSLVLAITMSVLMFAGCGAEAESDEAYVKEKGTLIVGITDFAPMDYQDAEGNWIGFDADMARAFAESLGVKVQFVEITWSKKHLELDAKNIDVVWNGMTISDDVKELMSVSKAYCKNAQVVVINADKAADYQTVEACKSLNFAVESGSAGAKQAAENGFNYTEFPKQANALMEVAAGTSDAAIIDLLMAGATIGEGTSYENLTYTISLNSEEYGVGFRKGSDLTEKLNKFFDECIANGTMDTLANKYGTQESIIK